VAHCLAAGNLGQGRHGPDLQTAVRLGLNARQSRDLAEIDQQRTGKAAALRFHQQTVAAGKHAGAGILCQERDGFA
jgi:hypothetical protein